MTGQYRIDGLTVTLDEDLSLEESKAVVDAICRIRGVLSVATEHVPVFVSHMAKQRVREDWREKILAVMDEGMLSHWLR